MQRGGTISALIACPLLDHSYRPLPLDLLPARATKGSTTPDDPHGESHFTVTHPFHPDFGHTFVLLSQRKAWGEWRVFFHDPQTHHLRSLPIAWTTLALADPFLVVAQGHTVLRFIDLQHLAQLLRARLAQQEES